MTFSVFASLLHAKYANVVGVDNKTALGGAIRRHREKAGLTQQELGTRAGYKAGAGVSISRIESGGAMPGPSKLGAIARALGTTAETLELEAGIQRGGAAPNAGRRQNLKARREQVEVQFIQRSEMLTRLEDDYYGAAQEATAQVVGPLVAICKELEGMPAGLESADIDDAKRIGLLSQGLTGIDESGPGNFLRMLGVQGVTGVAGAGGPLSDLGGGFLAKKVLDFTAAHGTSSTGVPINTLNGAARTSAALSRLGLGSKAVGKFGMQGGRLALGAVAALPAVIAVGGVFALAKRSDRQELERKLPAAENFLSLSEERFQAVITHMTESAEILKTAITHGSWALEVWLESLVSPTGERFRSWDELDDSQQARFTQLAHVATCIGALLALRPEELLTARSADLPTIDELTFDAAQTDGQNGSGSEETEKPGSGPEEQPAGAITFEVAEQQFREIRQEARSGIRSALGRRN